jgi:outer membrane protein, heavy metal efflux system
MRAAVPLWLVPWLLLVQPAAAQSPSSPGSVPLPLTLDAAIERALAAHPAIAAARARRQVDLANIEIARERPNPEAHIEVEREAPTHAYGVAIPFEAGGKRGRRIAAATASMAVGEAELAATIFGIRAAVRRAYFERVVADARLTLLRDLRDISQRIRDVAQQRFDAGDVPRLEVVQAQLTMAQADNEVAAAEATASSARIRLNALLALPLAAPTALSASLDVATSPAAEAVSARAQFANAELQTLARRIEEQQMKIAVARSLQTPDVTPDFTITRGNEPEFGTGWRAAVSMAVPIFTSHRAGVRLEEAALAQLTLEREATSARINGEIAAAAAEADAQQRVFTRYRTEIIPQALEAERMAEDAYRLGQTGITAFLLAMQMSKDVQLRSIDAAAGFQTAFADLERAAGAPLP